MRITWRWAASRNPSSRIAARMGLSSTMTIFKLASEDIGKEKPLRFCAPCGVFKINATRRRRLPSGAIFFDAGAHDREQRRVGIAVGYPSSACLDFTDIIPEIEIDLALKIIHFIAEGRERALQLDPLLARHGLTVA